ncbi:hypothetical protein [Vibrio toranzoniae]|uniref:hypothetical protein n=1 Tax=Vibrio toranzoniae TaxID=1194427 RepID=UPI001378AEE2|nr:hypothetical protein [Vibrio toranzoniae]NAZ91639.1 hypothetical protein [Vibrio toranzoniae]
MLLSNDSKVNSIFLVIIFLIALQVKVLSGLYLSTIVVFVVFMFFSINNNIKFSSNEFIILFSFLTVVTFCTLIQNLNLDGEILIDITVSDFILIYKVVVCWMLWKVINLVYTSNESYLLILFLLSIPLFFSFLLYLFPSLNSVFYIFYKQEIFPVPGRFGGIFGRDVNTLGMYASLFFLYSAFLMLNQKVSAVKIIPFLVLSLICVFISGMRSGLLVSIPIVLSYLFLSGNWFNIAKLCFLCVVLLCISYFSVDFFDSNTIDTISERFSLNHLLIGLGLTGDGSSGNLSHALNWLDQLLDGRTFSLYTFLFGYDLAINFVDNLYIYIYVKHGFITCVFIFTILLGCLFFERYKYNFTSILMLVFTLVISIKGIFLLNEYFVLFILLILKALNEKEINS